MSHDCLRLIADDKDADIIAISEPNRLERKGACYIDTEGVRVISCYASPNKSLNHLENVLAGMSAWVRGFREGVVVAGDLNAKSQTWNCPLEDSRGKTVTRWMASLGLSCLNKGGEPTFIRDRESSIIDVTLGNDKISRTMGEWGIIEEETLSLHKAIITVIKRNQSCIRVQRPCVGSVHKGWSLYGLQEKNLVEKFKDVLEKRGNPQSTLDLKNGISETCDAALKRRGNQKRGVWNDSIKGLRQICTSARRTATRLARRRDSDTSQAYDAAKEAYSKA